MVKCTNTSKPNLIKLLVRAKCHHGIRHPKFLMAKFKSRQHRPVKRCTKALKCPKVSNAVLSKFEEVAHKAKYGTRAATAANGVPHLKFKGIAHKKNSDATTTNSMPLVMNEDDEIGLPCRCEGNSIGNLSNDFETFSTEEIHYDSFADDGQNLYSNESDLESDSEPLYRSLNASLESEAEPCEMILAVNGNRIASKTEMYIDGQCTDDADDTDDSAAGPRPPIAKLTRATYSEDAKPLKKLKEQGFEEVSGENPGMDQNKFNKESGNKWHADESKPRRNVEESSHLSEDNEQVDEIQKENSPEKKHNPHPVNPKHRIYSETANSFIMVLDHPARLSLAGKVQVSVLWGCLSINGYHLKPHMGFIPIYSPSTSSSVEILTYHDGTATPPTESEKKAFENFRESQDSQLLSSPDGGILRILKKTVGVQCKRLFNTACSYVERFFQDVFDINHQVPGFFSAEKADHYGCQFYNAHESNIRFIKSGSAWKEIADNIIKCTQSEDTPPRIIVCGGKRVGKSTFCHYLLNTLLNFCDKVSFMDTDPGQCEFTPPGLVSLMELTEPCFGPAFTHLLDAKSSFFVGGPSVENSPSHFIKCIGELWQNYLSSDSKEQPLVINTMGWNKGIGLAFLMDIIHIIQPTHVIQINSEFYQFKNFSPLSLEYVNSTPGWELGFPDLEIPYAHFILKSGVYDRIDFSQIETRKINLLSYFSRYQESSKFQPLNQVKTFTIPWSAVALHVCQTDVLKSQILYVYNASIVALCKCDDDKITSSADPTLPKFIKDLPVCKFLGYGIIRGISMEEKCFYVITCLDSESLKEVNALLKGTIAMPEKLLLEQDVGGPIPYLIKRSETSTLKIGHKPIPKRNYVKKFRRMSPKRGKTNKSPNFMPLNNS